SARLLPPASFFLFCTHPAPPAIYTLSLHDALPISFLSSRLQMPSDPFAATSLEMLAGGFVMLPLALYTVHGFTPSGESIAGWIRSEEHTSELQSRGHLVCRLLLEKKKRI